MRTTALMFVLLIGACAGTNSSTKTASAKPQQTTTSCADSCQDEMQECVARGRSDDICLTDHTDCITACYSID